jgi:hypothetical protein
MHAFISSRAWWLCISADYMFWLYLQHISVVFQVIANGVGLLDPGAESNYVSVCP